MWHGATLTNQRFICSFIEKFLVSYGSSSSFGLTSQESSPTILVTTFFSLFIIQVIRRSVLFLKLLWLLYVWLVWNECNNGIFNNIQASIVQLLDRVKYYSLWWLQKANNVTFMYGSHIWWSDPFIYLGTDRVSVIIILDWLFLGATSLIHLVIGRYHRLR